MQLPTALPLDPARADARHRRSEPRAHTDESGGATLYAQTTAGMQKMGDADNAASAQAGCNVGAR